ncbi:non-structural maintenance of chromosomes element 3 homolog [Panonychus citri]|uniref:non-structural maintenance of chromosomes element 3 homolog n=1 Tax=Panonychus citri TaxID=50023 RepID=UPI0023074216|nr:non-structural maintenance of chromosomes element 3 homolog [Panonychus citri]
MGNDQHVVNMVQYLLVADQKKLPVKRADIVRHSIPDNAKEFNEIFSAAKAALLNVFGLKVKETPEKNCYILVTVIRDANLWRPEITSQIDQTHGLLIPILSVIFMNGGETREENLWKFLSKMGLTSETKLTHNHTSITLKDLLHSIWPRHLYLAREDIGKNEKKEYMFSWGFRAEHEINKLDLIKWVCEVYGDGYEPHMFKIQYKKAVNHDTMLNSLDKDSGEEDESEPNETESEQEIDL